MISHRTLVDARVGGAPAPRERVMDLSPLFPAVRRQGYDVVALMSIMPMQGRAFVALLAPTGAAIVSGRSVPDVALGVLACSASDGWALVAPPAPLRWEGVPRLVSHGLVHLPSDRYAETVTVRTVAETLESNTTAYLLGRGDDAIPVQSPPGATIGVLGDLGAVGERVVPDGLSEYRTLAPLAATGWYPLGSERVFLRVARERTPSAAGRWTDLVLASPRARVGPQGLTVPAGDDDAGAVWTLLGVGEMPAWCQGREDLRCTAIGGDDAALSDGAVPFTWLAGAWPVGGAVPREVRAPGARWLHVGAVTGRSPPRDPSGRDALTSITVAPAAAVRR